MRISAIQCHTVSQSKPMASRVVGKVNRLQTQQPEQSQPIAPTFKGNGTGGLLGFGAGVIGGLLILGGAAITGGLILPGIVAGGTLLGTGLGGAAIGDKIEDKITGKK